MHPESDQRQPYLSIVAASRNDNHGGNLLGRMQAFVNGLVQQCRRFDLSAELVLVEWNPPADRPRLAQALAWPADPAPLAIRIIEVPPRLHRRFRHSRSLALFQMIAKNVGIRRARGRFILATNIDVLFSDELMKFLSAEELEPGRMYRLDRFDVSADLPVDSPIEQQLDWCRRHLLRVNARDGTFALTPDGRATTEPADVMSATDGLQFGAGWYGLEKQNGEPFRWVADAAVLDVTMPAGGPYALNLELEPGPGVNHQAFELEVRDAAGRAVARGRVDGSQVATLRLPLAPGQTGRFTLHVPHGGRSVPNDWRTLNFRVFRCFWSAEAETPAGAAPETETAFNFFTRRVLRWHPGELWHEDIVPARHGIRFGRGWHSVERWHGSLFRWAGNDAELFIRTGARPPRTWWFEIEPGPGMRHQPFELEVFDDQDRRVARAPVAGHGWIALSLPLSAGRVHGFRFHVQGRGGWADDDSRVLNYRVFAPIRTRRPLWPINRRRLARRLAGWLPDSWACRLKRLVFGPNRLSDLHEPPPPGTAVSPLPLHLNACGDFTLMAREHWFAVRGYAEWPIFSLHLDSLLCYAACHAGAEEVVLPESMRIYHIEHAAGSGWTPEGAEQLVRRIAASGIPILSVGQVLHWAAAMRRRGRPMIVNDEHWGLAREHLPETTLPGRRDQPVHHETVSSASGGRRHF